MTIIAWDGKTLAADKRATQAGIARTVTKIIKGKTVLIGIAGNLARASKMVSWYLNGMEDIFPFPPCEKDDDYAQMVIIASDGVSLYDRFSTPVKFEDKTFAMGTGRDYAMAAMHCGKTAREAVEIACLFDIECGNGIDELTL